MHYLHAEKDWRFETAKRYYDSYLKNVIEKSKLVDPDIMHFIVFTDENNKIECINPQLLKDSEYQSILDKLDGIKETMVKFEEDNKSKPA